MEKRNRLERRGQSPPPNNSKVNAARVLAVLALTTAFVVLALVIAATLGAGKSILIGVGAFTYACGLLAAWIELRASLINHRTALIDHETALLNREAAEESSSNPPR